MQRADFWAKWRTPQQQSLPHLKNWNLKNLDMGLEDLYLDFDLQNQ